MISASAAFTLARLARLAQAGMLAVQPGPGGHLQLLRGTRVSLTLRKASGGIRLYDY